MNKEKIKAVLSDFEFRKPGLLKTPFTSIEQRIDAFRDCLLFMQNGLRYLLEDEGDVPACEVSDGTVSTSKDFEFRDLHPELDRIFKSACERNFDRQSCASFISFTGLAKENKKAALLIRSTYIQNKMEFTDGKLPTLVPRGLHHLFLFDSGDWLWAVTKELFTQEKT